jgi:L-seryl-tRNA(Ser) seleniumtransferase
MRRDPLARAMRPDKVTLAAVAATLGIYRAGRARTDIPVWRALGVEMEGLRERATRLAAAIGGSARASVIDARATVGGGALPGETLPSVALRVADGPASRLAGRLRAGDPCVIGRIEANAVLLDLRTVDAAMDDVLAEAVMAALGRPGSGRA